MKIYNRPPLRWTNKYVDLITFARPIPSQINLCPLIQAIRLLCSLYLKCIHQSNDFLMNIPFEMSSSGTDDILFVIYEFNFLDNKKKTCAHIYIYILKDLNYTSILIFFFIPNFGTEAYFVY